MGHKQLTEEQRYQIYAFGQMGYNQVQMADELGVHKSTISRELRRNSRPKGYYPGQAHWYSQDRRRRAKKCLKLTDDVKKYIHQKLQHKWSPEQISGYAKKHKIFSLSHERIYQYVISDKNNDGKLYLNLRHQNKKYRKRFGNPNNRSPIKNRIFIDDRPKVVDEKNRVGDWEVDTVIGSDRHHSIVTKVESRKAKLVRTAIVDGLKPYSDFVLTITSDNGVEFAEHQKIKESLDTNFYFAHPYSSWERGLNENTNGLLRQYLPKGSCFKDIEETHLSLITDELNNRPRKTLNYLTPNEAFELALNNRKGENGKSVAFNI